MGDFQTGSYAVCLLLYAGMVRFSSPHFHGRAGRCRATGADVRKKMGNRGGGARRPGRRGGPASALMLPRQRGAKWSRVTQTAAAQGLLLWTGWSRVNVEPVSFPLLWTRWSRVNRPVIPMVCVTLDHLMQVTRGGSGRGKLSMNTGSENPFSDWCYEKPLRQTARQNIQSGQSPVDG